MGKAGTTHFTKKCLRPNQSARLSGLIVAGEPVHPGMEKRVGSRRLRFYDGLKPERLMPADDQRPGRMSSSWNWRCRLIVNGAPDYGLGAHHGSEQGTGYSGGEVRQAPVSVPGAASFGRS